ncbi:exodeoxyribonuclease VII small subunit [Gordonia sp. SL306]|uniref:exodeoxyribonuclease VII small subunit n=1 Tax=Gordonia sp. SL306 TaxID=2995145 RepID=UPI00226E4523|nr:exodeoxyribonuclease VII small subunit [Gordonia sp. SL306]WAC54706.1 exodeoxyribonuclease VII small subunit [Gordonia sp. SL306]
MNGDADQENPGLDDGDWTPVEELGYEEARDELVDVVATLEHGGLDLDASLALWERGEALAARCEEHLAGARDRIESALAESDADDD